MSMKQLITSGSLFVILVALAGRAQADCEALSLHHGVAEVVLTAARPFNKPAAQKKFWLVDLKVERSLDTHITEERGKRVTSFTGQPFFKGSYKQVPIQCDPGVCELLGSVNFKKQRVKALVSLSVDCFDATDLQGNPAGLWAAVVQASTWEPAGQRFYNVLSVTPRS